MNDLLRRPRIRLAFLAALLTLGCSVASTEYRGTYTRTWLADHGGTEQISGDVRLVLTEDGRYRIEGDHGDTPPSREGRYRREGDAIARVQKVLGRAERRTLPGRPKQGGEA